MPKESEPEEKLKLPPREPEETDILPGNSGEPTKLQGQTLDAKKLKWSNRLRQTGIKFPAKMISKPNGSSGFGDGELPPGQGANNPEASPGASEPTEITEPATIPEQGSKEESGPPPAKTLKPEGWESSFSPPTLPARKRTRPDEKKPRPLDPGHLTRRKAVKRVRLLYVLPAGLITIILFSIVFWNLGFEAGIESSLVEETRQKATASNEFLADLDQALADLRAGNTDKAVMELRELEDTKSDVASVTYLLAVAAVQNGDIRLAEAKTAESISKRERISDSIALQAVLETQKARDPSLKKFGDTQVRSEALLRQAMLADEANPFPMVELATLLRYQKRNDEALALLRGARSRLNPVDSHSVVDVTIGLATLQDTPDDQLPQIAEPGKDMVSAFTAAYVAMRKGDFVRAAACANIARKLAAPDLFDYLINDPAIRRYAGEPKLKEFFQ
ncbi:MAG: hypothetical protein WCO94_00105 [Verrucomicrobiota bacterium]